MNSEGDAAIEVEESEILKKHRQERKELQSRIQSLKKSVPKGDKKKKKEITEEIAKLEQDLSEKLNEALNQSKGDSKGEISSANESIEEKDVSADMDDSSTSDNTRVSRAQRRRNKKVSEEQDRDKRITEQSELNKKGARTIEINQIKEKLKPMKLKLFNIEADGNCLYCAIIHQLEIAGKTTYDVNDLRRITAQFIRDHRDDFLPFMVNESNDAETVSEEYFENYCKEIANTKLWGGQLELRAMSNIFMSPIKIIQAAGPTTVQGESFSGPELIITYHRHLYRLGEHYNSTVPDTTIADDDVD